LALYGETHIFLLGGVTLKHEALDWVFYASEESGINKMRKMITARHSFCGLILGKSIYIFGGIGKLGVLKNCEKLNFST